MGKVDEDIPLSEPELVTCVYLTGTKVEDGEEGVYRLTGWTDMPNVGEKRIIVRFAMPNAAWRKLLADLKGLLARGH